jgi:hypothetical protein
MQKIVPHILLFTYIMKFDFVGRCIVYVNCLDHRNAKVLMKYE